MEINAKIIQTVEIDPTDVIIKLIKNVIGSNNYYIFEKNDKYYKSIIGYQSFDKDEEIDNETYEYIKALELILKYINKNESKK